MYKIRIYNLGHITLIVWGVPWGRKIPPSSFLWAGGSQKPMPQGTLIKRVYLGFPIRNRM